MNERIRAREVRVIGPDGEQLGIMTPQDATKKAREQNLDLVEISATAVPPVCRIMDCGVQAAHGRQYRARDPGPAQAGAWWQRWQEAGEAAAGSRWWSRREKTGEATAASSARGRDPHRIVRRTQIINCCLHMLAPLE